MDLQQHPAMLPFAGIIKKEIDIQNASSCVGKILMDEYVTPQLEKILMIKIIKIIQLKY